MSVTGSMRELDHARMKEHSIGSQTYNWEWDVASGKRQYLAAGHMLYSVEAAPSSVSLW